MGMMAVSPEKFKSEPARLQVNELNQRIKIVNEIAEDVFDKKAYVIFRDKLDGTVEKVSYKYHWMGKIAKFFYQHMRSNILYVGEEALKNAGERETEQIKKIVQIELVAEQAEVLEQRNEIDRAIDNLRNKCRIQADDETPLNSKIREVEADLQKKRELSQQLHAKWGDFLSEEDEKKQLEKLSDALQFMSSAANKDKISKTYIYKMLLQAKKLYDNPDKLKPQNLLREGSFQEMLDDYSYFLIFRDLSQAIDGNNAFFENNFSHRIDKPEYLNNLEQESEKFVQKICEKISNEEEYRALEQLLELKERAKQLQAPQSEVNIIDETIRYVITKALNQLQSLEIEEDDYLLIYKDQIAPKLQLLENAAKKVNQLAFFSPLKEVFVQKLAIKMEEKLESLQKMSEGHQKKLKASFEQQQKLIQSKAEAEQGYKEAITQFQAILPDIVDESLKKELISLVNVQLQYLERVKENPNKENNRALEHKLKSVLEKYESDEKLHRFAKEKKEVYIQKLLGMKDSPLIEADKRADIIKQVNQWKKGLIEIYKRKQASLRQQIEALKKQAAEPVAEKPQAQKTAANKEGWLDWIKQEVTQGASELAQVATDTFAQIGAKVGLVKFSEEVLRELEVGLHQVESNLAALTEKDEKKANKFLLDHLQDLVSGVSQFSSTEEVKGYWEILMGQLTGKEIKFVDLTKATEKVNLAFHALKDNLKGLSKEKRFHELMHQVELDGKKTIDILNQEIALLTSEIANQQSIFKDLSPQEKKKVERKKQELEIKKYVLSQKLLPDYERVVEPLFHLTQAAQALVKADEQKKLATAKTQEIESMVLKIGRRQRAIRKILSEQKRWNLDKVLDTVVSFTREAQQQSQKVQELTG